MRRTAGKEVSELEGGTRWLSPAEQQEVQHTVFRREGRFVDTDSGLKNRHCRQQPLQVLDNK